MRERERGGKKKKKKKGTKITKYHKLQGKKKLRKNKFFTHRDSCIHTLRIHIGQKKKENGRYISTTSSIFINMNKLEIHVE